MRIGISVLLFFACLTTLSIAPANAQDYLTETESDVTTLTLGLQTNDARPEYGIDLSNGKPVSRLELRHTWEHFSIDFEGTTIVSDKRGYGNRRPSNAFSFGGEHRGFVRLDKIDISIRSGVRYVGQNFRSKQSTVDDEVWIYADIGVPLRLSRRWTIEPYYRRIGSIPVVRNNRLSWHKVGLRTNGNLGHGVQVEFTLSDTIVDASITATPQREIVSLYGGLSKTLRNGTIFTVGGEVFTPMKAHLRGDQFIARDGKFMQRLEYGREWRDRTTITGRVSFTRHF